MLEVVRSNYEQLTLKLPLGIDACERYNELAPSELAFFTYLVRALRFRMYSTVLLLYSIISESLAMSMSFAG